LSYAEIEIQEGIFLFATQLQRELPLAATRVRKAFLNGAKVASLNAAHHPFTFSLDAEILTSPYTFEHELAGIMQALGLEQEMLKNIKATKQQIAVAAILAQEKAAIITGSDLEAHPRYHVLRAMLETIVKETGIKWLHLSLGSNTQGAWKAGFIPHFEENGQVCESKGMNVKQALEAGLKAYFLHGVEPSYDFDNPHLARKALQDAELVIAITAFKTDDLMATADILLPQASFGETSGTFINIDGIAQSFEGASVPYEQARPAWKIYRVLANLSHCDGFNYISSEEIKAELFNKEQFDVKNNMTLPKKLIDAEEGIFLIKQASLYAEDMLLRHSVPLQQSASADTMALRIHPDLAKELKLGAEVTVTWADNKLKCSVLIDENISKQVVSMPRGTELSKQVDRQIIKVSLQ
jgi:NADH-quinone oxidoreductase subunit G